MKRTVFNVVSGKGGTGKTLLACVIADMLGNAADVSVAVVDLDIFVRGLTSLLYYRRGEKLRLVEEGEVATSDFFLGKWTDGLDSSLRVTVSKYRSFDVVPAVRSIDQILNATDISPATEWEARKILWCLIEEIPEAYNYIILDSRAGYDETIAAAHNVSDVSICVEEPDPISKITADNLIAQLRQGSDRPIVRVINKARPGDIDRERRDTADLGVIPFDMDVLNNFGESSFWNEITNSMYRSAVVEVWNRLASKIGLSTIVEAHRVSPVVLNTLEPRLGRFSSIERIILIYGITAGIGGFAYGLYGEEFYQVFMSDLKRLTGMITGVLGLMMTLYVVLRARARRRYPAGADTSRIEAD